MTVELPFSPACERNREPILEQLQRILPAHARVLEIGAGTGQHAEWFGRKMPRWRWLPSDVGTSLWAINARIAQAELENVLPAVALDVAERLWPPGPFDAVYSANTLHIMPWPLTALLLEDAGKVLKSDGLLIIYGPFQYGGRHTASSNAAFDADLRRRDPQMGVRDGEEVVVLAASHGLSAEADVAMPSNNRLLIFRKT